METVMPENSDVVFIYVTFPERDLARRIGREVVKAKLAACANVFADHDSIYAWKGEIKSDAECAVIFKTAKVKAAALATYIVAHHPYETPCLAVLTPDQMNLPFADWVRFETTASET